MRHLLAIVICFCGFIAACTTTHTPAPTAVVGGQVLVTESAPHITFGRESYFTRWVVESSSTAYVPVAMYCTNPKEDGEVFCSVYADVRDREAQYNCTIDQSCHVGRGVELHLDQRECFMTLKCTLAAPEGATRQ